MHEIGSHLVWIHHITEVFIVATRCLPMEHPIRLLLLPHFERALAVNNEAGAR